MLNSFTAESMESGDKSKIVDTPVAIFGFNRPECLSQVFNCVRQVKPRKLFLVLDAPRDNCSDDLPKWEACKKIFEGVDWVCDVSRNYAEKNMGCRYRMASGISWVFEQVEEAILLEDDCVPHVDFFRFCSELLERYRNDMRIGLIAGFIEHPFVQQKQTSYYFDRFPMIWGWATWRRAWNKFDATLSIWEEQRTTKSLYSIFKTRKRVELIGGFFDGVAYHQVSSWATIWWLACIQQNFLCIHPSVNLITNIGYTGAHNGEKTALHDVPSTGIQFPLIHPAAVFPDYVEEEAMLRQYTQMSLLMRLVKRVWRCITS